MKVEGFWIHVTSVLSGRTRPASGRAAATARRSDSADTRSLSWLLLDQPPEPAASAALEAAIQEGVYWVPAFELSRSLVRQHIWARL